MPSKGVKIMLLEKGYFEVDFDWQAFFDAFLFHSMPVSKCRNFLNEIPKFHNLSSYSFEDSVGMTHFAIIEENEQGCDF